MLDDLKEFVQNHSAHGRLVGDVSKPGPYGYCVTVACPCGVVFERWVTEQDAVADIVQLELRAAWN